MGHYSAAGATKEENDLQNQVIKSFLATLKP
jgi:hypothetical protein